MTCCRSFIKIAKVLFFILLLSFFTMLIAFPIYWIFASSLKPADELFVLPVTLLPGRISVQNFINLFNKTDVPFYFFNSVYVSVWVTVITIAISTLGAYSLTRYHYAGRELIAKLILFAYIFPGILILFPLHQIIVKLRLNDNFFGLILADLTFTVPFCLWMLRAFFAQLPVSLEESARIDGCTKIGAFFRVLLPIATPGIVASCVFAFILSWNEYMFALVFITKDSSKTLPLRIAGLLGHQYIDWGILLASSVIATFPIIIAFMFFQKYLIQGISAGAIKG